MTDQQQDNRVQGFSYAIGAEGVASVTPIIDERTRVRDLDDPAITRLVRQAHTFASLGVDPAKIGPPEEALNPEQATAYFDDKRHRRDLIATSGGEMSVWEGIEEAEANDPVMQHYVVAYEARMRSERALAALLVYEGSWEVRWAYRVFEARCEAKAAVRRFWTWLRKTEVRP